ncbi:MAG: DUF1566 domain-containing protein [Gammaproteobacteria bacterium]|nr:DUF1566 domain-containing protein [Gammaproteobacteria bacterium]
MQKPVSWLVRVSLVLAVALFSVSVHAQNTTKVVVIPMAGDDVEIMPEPFAPLPKQSPPNSDYTIGAVTVIDKITGLEWQRQDDDTERNWDDAFDYCFRLELGSKDDWRLPLIAELQSIVDYEASDPSINEAAFPNTNSSLSSGFYWSASTEAASFERAWGILFFSGNVSSDFKLGSNFVRCVR